MNPKIILIVAGGLLMGSFLTAFFISRGSPPPPEPKKEDEKAAATMPAEVAKVVTAADRDMGDMFARLRQQIDEYNGKVNRMVEDEKRLNLLLDTCRAEYKALEEFRAQVNVDLQALKRERADLAKIIISINRIEMDNLQKNAAIYDKMPAAEGSVILERMCANNQKNDAAKLLRYMTERTSAKILAEMKDKNLAAELLEIMKRLKEEG